MTPMPGIELRGIFYVANKMAEDLARLALASIPEDAKSACGKQIVEVEGMLRDRDEATRAAGPGRIDL